MTQPELRQLEFGGNKLAYRLREGASPALMFLPGYASDMEGTKALALDGLAAQRGLAMLRFDYSGTGCSEGDFAEGTLGRWLDEALHMLDRLLEGPVILVGSSMGGWIGLLAARRRPDRVAAFVGIAAAPDFTRWGYSNAEKAELKRSGRLDRPNPYGPEPYVTHQGFWESGEELGLLDGPVEIDCPVRLVHGDSDPEVPLEIAFATATAVRSADVQLLILKGGGHRLSDPHEIDAIVRTVAGLLESAE